VEAAPVQQAPEAIAPPAPRAAAPQAPAPGQRLPDPEPVQRRAGGRPPGIRAPDIPQPTHDPLNKNDWLGSINNACGHAGPRCVRVEFIFYKNDQAGKMKEISDPQNYSNCHVTGRTPSGQYMEFGSSFRVEVLCTADGSSPPGTPPDNNIPGTRSDKSTKSTQSDKKDKKVTQSDKKDKKGTQSDKKGEARTPDGRPGG
jgi:hypothetical protein